MTEAAPNFADLERSKCRKRRARTTRQLETLALRSFELADRVAAGELQFLDAVDVAFDSAVASGLADSVGYDVIQAVLAAAFEKVRPCRM